MWCTGRGPGPPAQLAPGARLPRLRDGPAHRGGAHQGAGQGWTCSKDIFTSPAGSGWSIFDTVSGWLAGFVCLSPHSLHWSISWTFCLCVCLSVCLSVCPTQKLYDQEDQSKKFSQRTISEISPKCKKCNNQKCVGPDKGPQNGKNATTKKRLLLDGQKNH
jgi:hypothetical protein